MALRSEKEVNKVTLKKHKSLVTKITRKRLSMTDCHKAPPAKELLLDLGKYYIEKAGNGNMKDQCIFTDDDYSFMIPWIVSMQSHGHPMSVDSISGFLNDIADEMVKKNPKLDSRRPIFCEKWIKKHLLSRPEAKSINIRSTV